MTKLENALMHVINECTDVTGREFQKAALKVAEGYYETDDLDEYQEINEFTQALADTLAEMPPPEFK